MLSASLSIAMSLVLRLSKFSSITKVYRSDDFSWEADLWSSGDRRVCWLLSTNSSMVGVGFEEVASVVFFEVTSKDDGVVSFSGLKN